MPASLVFVTGTARSGSTLLARALQASPEVELAIDAALPVFRSLRNAIVREAGLELAADAPLEDYYFLDERLRRMDAVQAGELDVAVDEYEWPSLRDAVRRRALDEAADLSPALGARRPATYRELFDDVVATVERVRGAADASWIGLKDVWTIEFVAPLARAYPDARFVVIHRDPRGILASIEALGARDPTQAGHPLSYARHWRKHFAFAARYAADPELRDRVHVVLYENLVRDPEHELQALATFLGLAAFEPMLAVEAREGNSSFAPTRGIDAAPVERWRATLAEPALKLVELVCGLEMEALGYAPLTAGEDDAAVLEHLVETAARPASWRSDLGDPERDYALELERRALAEAAPAAPDVRRFFLFEEALRAIRPAAVAG